MKTKKKRNRFTVEYLDQVEHCGSLEMAEERFDTLSKTIDAHVIMTVNKKVVYQHIPLKF